MKFWEKKTKSGKIFSQIEKMLKVDIGVGVDKIKGQLNRGYFWFNLVRESDREGKELSSCIIFPFFFSLSHGIRKREKQKVREREREIENNLY